jgi:GDP-4-dehydro-6-deoxy-D-mannose reductase
MRILITGCTGFAGGYLSEALIAQGDAALVGVSRQAAWPAHWRHLAGKVKLRPCDLGDRKAVRALLQEAQPEQIYHLAGYANTGESSRDRDAAWAGNLDTTRNLYEAVLDWGGQPRILHVSSGLVYEAPQTVGQLVDESRPLRPVSPYAASKAAADLAALQYSQAPGLDIVRVRPFNHIGPRQALGFVVPDFARQVAAIEAGLQAPPLETGDLSACRDFTDVRDVVRAYILVMNRGRSGEAYNVGSGRAYSMREVLDRLLARARVRVEVRQREQKLRVSEPHVLLADSGKLRRETGWEPHSTLDQSLADTLDYWRTEIERAAAGAKDPMERVS